MCTRSHIQSFIVCYLFRRKLKDSICEWWSFPLPYRYLHQHSNQKLVKRGGNKNIGLAHF